MTWDLRMHEAWTIGMYREAERSRLAAGVRRRRFRCRFLFAIRRPE